MKAVFLKEQKRYTRAQLIELLGASDERATNAFRKLKEFGILKPLGSSDGQESMSDLLQEDVLIVDADSAVDSCYIVTFVGLVVVGGYVLKCYPKYLADDASPTDKLAQILKVLEQYNAREQMVRMFHDTLTEHGVNLLAVILFLFRDYYENGIYTNSQEVIETNGSGEIHWSRTINDTVALLVHGRPHYVELQTKRRRDDDRDFFKRLHECVLTQFTREMREADLLALCDIQGVELSGEDIDALGDTDYLLYRIEGELGIQFNTRKQLVLKALHAHLSHRVTLGEHNGFSALGSRNFNLVWQSVCSSVIGNALDTPISALPLPTPLKPGYSGASTLQSLIDKPKWTGKDEIGQFSYSSEKTLAPDLATIWVVDGKHALVILDAKYYTIQLHRNKKLLGQPGIGDVTKQYLYQLAFQEFATTHDITHVTNCFLLPADETNIIDLGYTSLEMLGRLGLQDIRIILLPAGEMYDLYLHGKRIDVARLGL